ncbi:unnamed protein product [Mytilus edulis]|uniref:Uncharacterized protein n=1 Tax=Mytilus edulis TaxID=6550 RepID=A0A8S3VMZ0_MYTED|nr:unnamed protein product [Mytilus edulis]
MRSKSIQVRLDLPKETVRQPKLTVQEPPPVPSITSSPQPPNEPSPQKSMTDAFQTWENIRKTGEPRIVISLIGAYNEFIPTYKWKHQLLLKKHLLMLQDMQEDVDFFTKSMRLPLLKILFEYLQFSMSSTAYVWIHLTIAANETDYKVVMMKLLEIENYINTEGRVAFEDVTLRKRNVITPLGEKTYMSDKDESYLTTDLMNLGQIDFISQYVAEIDNLSKKELFGGYDIQTRFKSPVDLQHTFVNAFLSKRTDIIQQILSSKEPFALSKEQFTTLCQEVVKSRTSKPGNDKNGFRLLEV